MHTLDPTNDFFGCLLNCAVRYAVGRRTYMPGLVIDEITPLLPQLSDKTLWCFDQDLTDAAHMGGYGDPQIDAPKWHRFHDAVRAERTKRGDNLYQSYWEQKDEQLAPAMRIVDILREMTADMDRPDSERQILREAAILIQQLVNDNQALPDAYKNQGGA